MYFGNLINKHKSKFGLCSDTPFVVYTKVPTANFVCANTIDDAKRLLRTEKDKIYMLTEGVWTEVVFIATLKKTPQRGNVIKGFAP